MHIIRLNADIGEELFVFVLLHFPTTRNTVNVERCRLAHALFDFVRKHATLFLILAVDVSV